MTEKKTPLMRAAGAVHEAREALERVDSRLAEMRGKAQVLGELRAKLDSARERRPQLLETALLEGRTADTAAVDKEIAAAERALDKRQDEVTAVNRALETLEAQRQAAQAMLAERETEYGERREEHVRESDGARYLAAKFHQAITWANGYAAEMPTEGGFRERLTAAAPELLKGSESQLSEQALGKLVISRADAELLEADKRAAIPQPLQETNEYVWEDGSIHPQPEPGKHAWHAWEDGRLHLKPEPLPPPEPPVTVYRAGKVGAIDLPPGMPGVRRIA